MVRIMTIEDYDEGCVRFGRKNKRIWYRIRSIDDSKEGVARFLKRNPTTSVVAEKDSVALCGSILCGHDGRRGCIVSCLCR